MYSLQLSEPEMARYRMMAATAAEAERALWERAGIIEGAVVADVGCGPGAVSVILAEVVGDTGHVFAVDADANTVEAARANASASGCGNVTCSVGEATDTGLEAGTVDVVMIRHVLAHNGGREQEIVSHAATLIRPGGRVYLVDADGTAMRIRPADPDLDDLSERYQRFHAMQGNDLTVGLRLGELLTGASLEPVAYEGRYNIVEAPAGVRPPSWAARDAMVAAGVATDADVERWDQVLSTPLVRTVFAPTFVAIGRRVA